MVKSDIGDDTVAYCPKCVCRECRRWRHARALHSAAEPKESMEKVHTPNTGTIQEQAGRFLGYQPDRFAKTLLYLADGEVVAAMVRGDREIIETKLKNHLKCVNLELAGVSDVREATGAEVGFAGPVGLKAKKIVADKEILA